MTNKYFTAPSFPEITVLEITRKAGTKHYFSFDTEFLPEISKLKWCYSPTGKSEGYADNSKMGVRLHSYIYYLMFGVMNNDRSQGGFTIDHISQHSYDNRGCNLRPATSSLQALNRPRKVSKEGYRGIFRIARSKPGCNQWQARITLFCDSHAVALGSYKLEQEASAMFEAVRLDYLHRVRQDICSRLSPEEAAHFIKYSPKLDINCPDYDLHPNYYKRLEEQQ